MCPETSLRTLTRPVLWCLAPRRLDLPGAQISLRPGHPIRSGREIGWSGRRDSNPRPTAWKAVTLPLSYSRGGLYLPDGHLPDGFPLLPAAPFFGSQSWWRRVDSNHRRLTPADLQSAAFVHSATPPRTLLLTCLLHWLAGNQDRDPDDLESCQRPAPKSPGACQTGDCGRDVTAPAGAGTRI